MVTRIIYGLLAGAIAIGFLCFGTPGFIAFIYLLGYMAIYEINKAYKVGGINSVPVVGYAFITFLIPLYLMFGMIGVLVLLTLCMYLNFIYHILKQKVKEDLIYSNIQLIYPCLPIAFACPVLLSTTNPKVGFSVLLTLVCVCIGTDVFAYFAGVLRGKHKLCPEISPKKTIEGSIGGFCGAIVVAIFMHFIVWLILGVVLPVSFLLLMGILCGVFAQFGDLTASMVKRICGIKDYGNLIPGHGGILDRLDSIIFCLPIAYILMVIFKL